ncbi:MAG: PAS domain-containing protein [Parvibaculum sp.]|nr:PAS domain-containing protein [Parvibaculum sp.]
MHLPFEVDDRLALEFIAYWEGLRTSTELPVWDSAAVQIAIPELLPNIIAIEVREPKTLYVRQAGSAFRDHYGFEISGTDLLTYTQPKDVDERYRRFHAATAQPCAALGQAPIIGSHNIMIICDLVWLPVREAGTGKTLLITLHGLGGRKIYNEQSASVMPMARKFAFVDIGFGIPSPPEAPGRWISVKGAITRHLTSLRALMS